MGVDVLQTVGIGAAGLAAGVAAVWAVLKIAIAHLYTDLKADRDRVISRAEAMAERYLEDIRGAHEQDKQALVELRAEVAESKAERAECREQLKATQVELQATQVELKALRASVDAKLEAVKPRSRQRATGTKS